MFHFKYPHILGITVTFSFPSGSVDTVSSLYDFTFLLQPTALSILACERHGKSNQDMLDEEVAFELAFYGSVRPDVWR